MFVISFLYKRRRSGVVIGRRCRSLFGDRVIFRRIFVSSVDGFFGYGRFNFTCKLRIVFIYIRIEVGCKDCVRLVVK